MSKEGVPLELCTNQQLKNWNLSIFWLLTFFWKRGGASWGSEWHDTKCFQLLVVHFRLLLCFWSLKWGGKIWWLTIELRPPLHLLPPALLLLMFFPLPSFYAHTFSSHYFSAITSILINVLLEPCKEDEYLEHRNNGCENNHFPLRWFTQFPCPKVEQQRSTWNGLPREVADSFIGGF